MVRGFVFWSEGMTGADECASVAKTIRAAALVEQVQSRDRAVQARAAAAAAANATLLQGLDAFRGLHLDPNASHWDDVGESSLEEGAFAHPLRVVDGRRQRRLS